MRLCVHYCYSSAYLSVIKVVTLKKATLLVFFVFMRLGFTFKISA